LPTKLAHLKWHIAGFVDGDGSFPVVLSPVPDKKFGWLIQPRFQIELRDTHDSIVMLKIIEKTIGVGSNLLHGQNYVKLIVTNRRLLLEKVIPFFINYKLALKQDEFKLMKYVTEGLEAKRHLDSSGFKQVIIEIFTLHVAGETRRKWSFNDIIPEEQPPIERKPAIPLFPEGAELRHYLSGFSDAEGALGYAIILESKTITPYFTVTHEDRSALKKLQQTLQAGNISTGRLQVYGIEKLSNNVMPFLERHPLIAKRKIYLEFRKIFELVRQGRHKTRFEEIVAMVRSLNSLEDPQRSYAGHP
jgi:hypothetical protein